jgi:hypothetical protein
VRAYVRTSRNTGLSLGPAGLLVLAVFLLAGWVLYAAALVVYGLGKGIVEGIEAAAGWAENRQIRRRRARLLKRIEDIERGAS